MGPAAVAASLGTAGRGGGGGCGGVDDGHGCRTAGLVARPTAWRHGAHRRRAPEHVAPGCGCRGAGLRPWPVRTNPGLAGRHPPGRPGRAAVALLQLVCGHGRAGPRRRPEPRLARTGSPGLVGRGVPRRPRPVRRLRLAAARLHPDRLAPGRAVPLHRGGRRQLLRGPHGTAGRLDPAGALQAAPGLVRGVAGRRHRRRHRRSGSRS